MITISKEKEKQLIKQLLELDSVLHKIEIEKHYCNEEPEKSKIENLERIKKAEYEKIESDLQNLDNYEVSKDIRDDLLQAFTQMKQSISGVREKIQISRNQCMVLDNYFISKIFEETHNAMNLKFYGISKPFLYFTNESEDSFDRNELIAFLENEISILESLLKVDYVVLRDYHEEFKDRLSNLVE